MPIEVVKQFVDLHDEFEKARLSIGKRARTLLKQHLKAWLKGHPDRVFIKVKLDRFEADDGAAYYFDCVSEGAYRDQIDEVALSAALWPCVYVIRQGFKPGSTMTIWSRGKVTSYTPKNEDN